MKLNNLYGEGKHYFVKLSFLPIFIIVLTALVTANVTIGEDVVEGVTIFEPPTPQTILTGNLTNFTSLIDTPATYAGSGVDCVKVNAGETALEFGSCATGAGDNSSWNQSLTNMLYLNLSGTNANQNINITPYNLTVDNLFGKLNFSDVQNHPVAFGDIFVNESGDTMTGLLNMSDNNITQVSNINPSTGNTLTINPFSTGDAIAEDYDLRIGSNDAGALRLGNSRIVSGGNMTVSNADFNGSLLFLMNGTINSVFELVVGRVGESIRFAIPKAGADYAMQMVRSVMVGGDSASAFNDNIINCTAQGYTFIDCATDITGADLGVQDDLEVRGAGLINENLTTPIVLVDEVVFPNASIKSVVAHDLVNGTTYGVYMDGQSGTNKPTFWIQPGGPGQASGIVRSFIIVNEIDSLQNTTNITSCQAWADVAGETLQIDCNTTTSGADLIVGDDIQVFDDMWLKDTEGEWHFLTRDLQLSDELHENILFNRVNSEITGTNFTITSIENETLVVNINRTETIFTKNNDTIALNTGTNAAPTFNHISYQNPANPTLTISGSEPTVAHADVAKIYVGDSVNEIYMFDTSIAHNDEFINLVYERLDDAGAIYISGLDIGANGTDFNISSGTIKIRLDEVAYANTVNSIDEDFFFINSSGNFEVGTPVDGFVRYATGETVSNNKYFNVVVGVVPINQTTMRMMVILQDKPSTEYGSLTDAEADVFKTINFFPNNNNLKKVFVPVFRVIIKEVPGDNEFQILSNGLRFFDIRGKLTSSAGSPAAPPIINHDELNNLNATSSGHTGFIFADGTIPLTANWNAVLNISAEMFKGLFNWTVSSIYATFDGATLTLNDALLNTNFNQTDDINSVNTTDNIEALGFTQGAHFDNTNVAYLNESPLFSDIETFTINSTTGAMGRPSLLLQNENGDTVGPNMQMFKNSPTPADGDQIGAWRWTSNDDVGTATVMAQFLGKVLDVTNGDEAGQIDMIVFLDGAAVSFFRLVGFKDSIVGDGEVVINDESDKIHFRVESDTQTEALFVNYSTGNAKIATNLTVVDRLCFTNCSAGMIYSNGTDLIAT